jgi:UDP-glucose 4-epimerase
VYLSQLLGFRRPLRRARRHNGDERRDHLGVERIGQHPARPGELAQLERIDLAHRHASGAQRTGNTSLVNAGTSFVVPPPGLAGPGHRRYGFAKVDICNGTAVRRLFDRHQPDFVMNLAAESHVDRSIDGPGEFIQTNIVGTFVLLQEALRYWRSLAAARRDGFRLLHASTDEVYGTLGPEGLFTESTP